MYKAKSYGWGLHKTVIYRAYMYTVLWYKDAQFPECGDHCILNVYIKSWKISDFKIMLDLLGW